MVWRVEGEGKVSFLIGSVHFFPYSFKRSLRSLISEATSVVVEGPLGLDDLREVARKGYGGPGGELLGLLDESAIRRLETVVGSGSSTSEYLSFHLSPLGKRGMVEAVLGSMRPWMAFFTLWVKHLERMGWIHHMDRDAVDIGKKMGRKVIALEIIEEQVAALEEIPLERIVAFLNSANKWRAYIGKYAKLYLKGHLEQLLELSNSFPSRCEAVIGRRDKILFERMRPHIRQGKVVIMVGVPHVRAILGWLQRDGYVIQQTRIG